MLRIYPVIKNQFTYDSVNTEVYDDFDIDASVEALDTEDYADMEKVIRDSGRFFVDDDDPSALEFDPDSDIDSETSFEDDEGLFGH